MNKRDIAAEYIAKYPPDFPNLTLARIVYMANPTAFLSIEDARSVIRTVLGKNGKKNKTKKHKSLHVEKDKSKSPYSLPETWADERKVFKLPVGCNKIGFISDLQVPFHDSQAIETAFTWLKNKGINTLFLNGDTMDFYQLSNFQKDPRKRDFKQEYYTILQTLEYIRNFFPDITIYANIQANHELRYERYMMIKAPELLSLELPETRLEDLLKLSSFGIIPLRGHHHIMIGKLPVVHGHTLFNGQTSPVSTARTVYMKAKSSAIASHCHQVSEYTVRVPFANEIHTCWTTGCLMNLNVEYNQHGNNYQHGFAYIETDRDGSYRVENKRILNGVVL